MPTADTLRPSQVWLSTEDLLPVRCDAVFYSQQHMKAHQRLASAKCTANRFRDLSTRIFKGAFCVLSEEYTESGVPFLRTLDIKSGQVDVGSCAHLPLDVQERERGTTVVPGNILLAKTGASIGYSATVPPWLSEANICQDIVGVRLKNDVDPYFLQAFLSSTTGQLQAMRWRQGNAHPHLGLEGIREWMIPTPRGAVGRAIGNLLRKAERLSEVATTDSQQRAAEIDKCFGQSSRLQHRTTGWVSQASLGSNRIDAWFNQPFYIDLSESLQLRRDLIPLSEVTQLVTNTVRFESLDCKCFDYYEISDVSADSQTIASKPVAIDERPSRAKYEVHSGDILVSTVRPNLKGIAIVPDGVHYAVCSSGFSVIRAHDLPTAYYLRACLLSDVATHQLMRWNTGAVYPAIDRRVPLSVLVPRLRKEQIEEIGGSLHRSAKDLALATDLANRARACIEALIDGTLDEPVLLGESTEIESWLNQTPSPIPCH